MSHLNQAWYTKERRKLPWRGDLPPYGKGKPKTDAASTTFKKYFKTDHTVSIDGSQVSQSPSEVPEITTVSPYAVWVSEVMLQQTRVETVIDYHMRWMKAFPSVAALAQANIDDINKLWEGLGYYRRAKLLQEGAKKVVHDFHGNLPPDIEDLKQIPGIGPYTAGAISSIAFQKPVPLVDGNVIRVLSRTRAIAATPKNKLLVNLCWTLAGKLVSPLRPGDFNQALMELGATLCTVQSPRCKECPVRESCLAYREVTTRCRPAGPAPTPGSLLKTQASSSAPSPHALCSICDASESNVVPHQHPCHRSCCAL